MRSSQTIVWMLAAIAWVGGTLHAQTEGEEAKLALELGVPFADHAVLQQQMKVPVWGSSLPGARVTVRFDGQTIAANADDSGSWRVVLDPIDAVKLQSVNDCPEGKTMVIVCEKDGRKEVKEIKNLIMGDVWLCAGQSNMAGKMRTNKTRHFPEDSIEKANYPALRQMVSGDGKPWLVCSPETAPEFKKVAFFFGRRLQQDALVPVGLISAAVGGSKIESWLNQEPYPTGGNFTRLIEPLVGYGLRGALWYQGESNEKDRRQYQPKLESLITGWRKAWNQPPSSDSLLRSATPRQAGAPGSEFPFYYVQLPGIGTSSLDNPAGGDGRAEIRQACVETLKLKNTGLAVTIDVGAKGEHPPNKYDTGVRLARLALHHDYGFTDLAPCPLYKSHVIEGDSIRIAFDHAEDGLMIARKEGFLRPTPTPDAKLQWLSIQAKGGRWHWADGQIDPAARSGLATDTLVVFSKDVNEPIAVRYAYTQHPAGHLLYNKEGQPVSPFSTIGYELGPGPAAEKPYTVTETEIKLPGVTIDRATREVRIEATACLESGILEYVVCRPGTFEHEAIFTTDAKPELVHAALLLAGLKPTPQIRGLTELWWDQALKQKDSRVKIEVEWKDEEGMKRINLTSMLRSREGRGDASGAEDPAKQEGEAEVQDAWVFAGSFLHANEERGAPIYAANVSGILVGIWPDPSTVIQYGVASANPYEGKDLGMEINEERVPKKGTRVNLILSLYTSPANRSSGGTTVDQ